MASKRSPNLSLEEGTERKFSRKLGAEIEWIRSLPKSCYGIVTKFLLHMKKIDPQGPLGGDFIIGSNNERIGTFYRNEVVKIFRVFPISAEGTYPLFMKATRISDVFDEAIWAKAAFNLLLYMLAGHDFNS
ncbi:hypothetical protein Patl1_25789 [Pistacia atlantica]|uniref:Uncharacterized protein n=1 Tax=Pistacia atlantica TaxID=434234 RepID=A0ACC1B2D8_9ROSI|nr:hypothetical protein Patl1_25789 [Pistacia atlantica]